MDAIAVKTPVPNSVIPRPEGLWNGVKYVFWRAITPGYKAGLNVLLKLHILHHEGRQNWVIGTIAPGRTVDDFARYLHAKDFWNNFIAWTDDGQIISLRKLVGFEWQYHLRIFRDGEVRGHYEYTPESHPAWHLNEKDMQERREDFLRFVGDWVVPAEKK